jgi:hypothetical protein
MLTHLLVLGLLAGPTSGSGTDTGAVIATPDRTASMAVIQSAASRPSNIPLGAVTWSQPYDPGDHAPYAINFTDLLDEGETIASIDAIKVPSSAVLLGISVDTAAGYGPIIDIAGKKIQLWFLVDQTAWESASFTGAGVQLPITVRVNTGSTPPKRYERTAVLTVRQL